ncbi:MAG: hypothetical protein B6244_03350 [Candidatus Cloacimonetes bacterium 4572_55]|nr:MAG: hypothetical protein B6244_03350 [Candidatus Cloacimonetes bacterium 4572_55]
MDVLFKKTKQLESRIDNFLDTVSKGALIFKQGIRLYLNNNMERFEESRDQINKLENKADDLRKNVENHLYSHSLIPEHRGDVLGLLESMDDVIDVAKQTLNQFSVEIPNVPEDFHKYFIELTDKSAEAAGEVVCATRAFFKNVHAVKNHLHKVSLFEEQADDLADRLKREIFRKKGMNLSHRIHLRYFALHIGNLSDAAEDVADRLAIYTIKRTI